MLNYSILILFYKQAYIAMIPMIISNVINYL